MICPINNQEHLPSLLTVSLSQELESYSDENARLLDRLNTMVKSNEEAFLSQFGDLIPPDYRNSTNKGAILAGIFYENILKRGFKGFVSGTEIQTDYGIERLDDMLPSIEPKSFSSRTRYVLSKLSTFTGVPYSFYTDVTDSRRGYISRTEDGYEVYVNLAYATESTPLHEYYHPFVSALREVNPALYEEIATVAKRVFPKLETEEAVVEYLASRKTYETTYQRFKSFVIRLIQRIFGIQRTIKDITTLGELMIYLDKPVREDLVYSQITVANSLLQDYYVNLRSKDARTPPDYHTLILKWVQEQGLVTADNLDTYRDKDGKDVAKRASAFVGDKTEGEFVASTRKRRAEKFTFSYAESLVRKILRKSGKNIPDDQPLDLEEEVKLEDGNVVTVGNLLKTKQEELEKARNYGKMVHAFIQYLVETNQAKKTTLRSETISWAKKVGLEGIDLYELNPSLPLEKQPDLKKYAGAVKFVEEELDLSFEAGDKIIAEVSFASEGLFTDANGMPIGTTADLIVITRDGQAILVDWKTGNIFSDSNTAWLMPYGEDLLINDSKLSRASLEITLRAAMLKEKFPDLRFKGVYIVKLSKFGKHYLHQVNIEDYLTLLKNFYTAQERYANFKEAGREELFQGRFYLGTSPFLTSFRRTLKDSDGPTALLYAKLKLRSLTQKYSKDQIAANPDLADEVEYWTKIVLELEARGGYNIYRTEGDLPDVVWNLYSLMDIQDPKVVTLKEVLQKSRQNLNSEYQALIREHDRLAKAVIDEKVSKLGTLARKAAKVGLVTGIVTANPFIFVSALVLDQTLKATGLSTRDVFGFMFRESKDPARPGVFLNTSDEYRGVPLTKAEREYRDFFKKNIHRLYKEVWNLPIIDQLGKDSTVGKMSGLPENLPDDFLPRVPKRLTEVNEEIGPLKSVFGIRTTIGYFFRKYFTDYLDQFISEQPVNTINIKYVLPDDSGIIASGNHSMDPTVIFSAFTISLLNKKHLDDPYSLMLGLRSLYETSRDFRNNKTHSNMVAFLDAQLKNQFPLQQPPDRLSRRPIKVPPKMLKAMGFPEDLSMTLDLARFSQLIRSGVSHAALGFKVVTAFKNLVLITIVNHIQATRSSVGRLVGAPPSDLDPTLSGAIKAYGDVVGLMKDFMLGRHQKNKLWMFAKEIDFIPDNQAQAANVAFGEEFYHLGKGEGIFSMAFAFQHAAETFGALLHLAILLRSSKMKNAQGETFSAWDAYKVEGDKLVWTKGKRGVMVVGEEEIIVEGLTSYEINAIKGYYRQAQGGYRKDEALALQANLVGQFLIQFKRHLFEYMKQMYSGPKVDYTIGYLKTLNDVKGPEGLPVLEWSERQTIGTIRAATAAMIVLFGLGMDANTTYRQSITRALAKPGMRLALAELATAGVWIVLMLIAYGALVDDDEEKTYAAKLAQRIVVDASRGLHPKDIIDFVKTPVLAATKSAEISQAAYLLFTEGLWSPPTRSGYPKGAKTLLRNIPGTSAALQLSELFQSDDKGSSPSLELLLSR